MRSRRPPQTASERGGRCAWCWCSIELQFNTTNNNARLSKGATTMPGMSDEGLLDWVNRIYYVAGAIAAFFTVVTIVSGYMQFKLNERISEKDRRLRSTSPMPVCKSLLRMRRQRRRAGMLQTLHCAPRSSTETARLTAENLRLQSQLMWRTLSHREASTIRAAVAPFQGQQVQIVSVMGDADGKQYGQQFAQIFRDAGWQCSDSDVMQAAFKQAPIGVSVNLNPSDIDPNAEMPAAVSLVTALADSHIIQGMRVVRNPRFHRKRYVSLWRERAFRANPPGR